ncbi:ABC transporter permease [Halomonas sp. M5N1S17]|uniref:ABC transporter permease n=1 Tax=Halomonas alkalisoli TaxID=2907158 RepID=UPI001F2E10D8|nr:ABC transporter permease [Halomonas alkalisoli]MCE9662822.1 ABC transporter permease [Halomonas alkalisoli]
MAIANNVNSNVAMHRKNKTIVLPTWFAPIAVVIALLIIWQVGVRVFGVPTFIAPAPTDVASAIASDYPILINNFWPTFVEALMGFFVGNSIAVALAIIFVHNKSVERAFFPLAVFVNTIPILAVAPILVLIFGNGLTAKVIISALICFFPTLVNMVKGLESVGKDALDLGRVLSATQNEILWKIRLPASLPYLFAALKIAATTCVVGAIVGEWVGADIGLGALILDATHNFRTPLLYAAVFASSMLAVTFFGVVTLVERRVIKWNPRNLR